ncbi:uncharacterized protein Dwil_GK15124 [Drosophila willistoni]|uniref:Uncharacterized protein n=1 Tax=Drosophila willistoni TaxID=7260 RepID=B4MX62_DROWI|nr:uncharacterized protein LOC124460753 [Drosophila willistoni]EDW76895.2 uncharacterized protein Dwil_GK15124 [Drosophila willistoni]
MHFKAILFLFSVVCLGLIQAQNQDCQTLRRDCDRCVPRLNDPEDRNIPGINRLCRQKLRRTWVWRNINRCELTEYSCRGADRLMNCEVIAALAGMTRRPE